MPQFKYVATNLQQQKITGTFIAENEQDLAIQLQKQGLYIISAKSYDGQAKVSFFSLSTGKVTQAEINTFCRQFAIMITAGISIVGCLDNLKEEKFSPMFKSVLVVLADDVRSGMMLSDALNKHKKVFPSFFRSMCSVGELSGKMDKVLVSLADYYEDDDKNKKKLISALSYPIMLLAMTVGIAIAMLAFIVPTFKESLGDMIEVNEGLTKVVWDMSDFLLANWAKMLIGLVVIALLIFGISRTKSGKLFFDKMKITAPLLKPINMAMISSKFARSFGLLLSSGMDTIEALENARIVFNNKDIEKRYDKAVDDVKRGINLSVAFEHYKLFPSILIQMIAVGEKTNSLDEVLNRCSGFFDTQVDNAISSISNKIQPILLCLMGVIIGGLFIALYSPILELIGQM